MLRDRFSRRGRERIREPLSGGQELLYARLALQILARNRVIARAWPPRTGAPSLSDRIAAIAHFGDRHRAAHNDGKRRALVNYGATFR